MNIFLVMSDKTPCHHILVKFQSHQMSIQIKNKIPVLNPSGVSITMLPSNRLPNYNAYINIQSCGVREFSFLISESVVCNSLLSGNVRMDDKVYV